MIVYRPCCTTEGTDLRVTSQTKKKSLATSAIKPKGNRWKITLPQACGANTHCNIGKGFKRVLNFGKWITETCLYGVALTK
jgi:hypothetical protein